MTTSAETEELPRHPIAVVAERTGLSQDVLRVWERRYGVVKPARAEGGQRLYSDADITRLGLLHAATRAGRSISQVAALSTEDVAAMVDEDVAARELARERSRDLPPRRGAAVNDTDRLVEESLALVRGLEDARLDGLLRRAVAREGVAPFLERVAAPLLRRVGDEWHAGRLTSAQEHMASAVVHRIATETLGGFTPRDGAPRMLVATPAGDRHAIGAAIVGAVGAAEGWSVLYLGADLPAAEIAGAARDAGVRLVALSVTYLDDRPRVLAELRAVRAALPANVVLLAGGAGAATLTSALLGFGLRVETTIPGLIEELRREQGLG